MKKILKIIFITCISFYAIFLAFLFFFQKSLLYFPDTTDFYTCDTFSQEEKKNYKNTRFYERKGEKDGVIIYFHGNGGRACGRKKVSSIFEKTEYSYILVEYTGYAEEDTSKTDINNILQDVENISEYIKNNTEYKKTYSAGRSIGTGPASYLTSKLEIQKLLLISPYSELYRVAADKYPIFPIKFLFTQNYNSIEYLRNYTGEVLILHGNEDRVIPQKFGRELYSKITTEKKYFYNISGGNHNNELYLEATEDKIIDYLE